MHEKKCSKCKFNLNDVENFNVNKGKIDAAQDCHSYIRNMIVKDKKEEKGKQLLSKDKIL